MSGYIIFSLLMVFLLVNCQLELDLLSKIKQQQQEKIQRETKENFKWVVKLKDGEDPALVSEQYSFLNEGPVRNLPNSYIFTLLPEFQLPDIYAEKVQQLQKAPQVLSYIAYNIDNIKKFFTQEYEKLESVAPGSARKLIEESRSSYDVQEEINKHASKTLQRFQKALGNRKVKRPVSSEWVVLLKSGVNADEIAQKYGFINRGHIKDSDLNNYIFKLKEEFIKDREIKERDISQDSNVIDVMSFDLDTLQKRREQVKGLVDNKKDEL